MSLLVNATVCVSALSQPEAQAPVAAPEYRPLTARMSAPSLSGAAQLRYVLQWFGEFSELQREDFLPVLVAARLGGAARLAHAMKALACDDKPVSLFQCRIKLFNDWYSTWTEDEQDRLIKGVTEIDPEFAVKLGEALMNSINVNGDQNGTGEAHSPDEDEVKDEPKAEVEPAVSAGEVVAAEAPSVQDNIPLEISAAS